VKDWFAGERTCVTSLLPGGAEALLVWSLHRALRRTMVLIADGPQSLEIKHQDLNTLALERDRSRLRYFPSAESPARGGTEGADPDVVGYRLGVLAALAQASGGRTPASADEREGTGEPGPMVIATCVQALMQTNLAPDALRERAVALTRGGEADSEQLTRQLADAGYAFEPEVVEKGKATLKGGLLDIWPLPEPWPFRIEFFGPVVESIRTFDPETQRSVAKLEAAWILPAKVEAGGRKCTLVDYLPPDTLFVWSDMGSIRYHASLLEELAAETEGRAESFSLEGAGLQIAKLLDGLHLRC